MLRMIIEVMKLAVVSAVLLTPIHLITAGEPWRRAASLQTSDLATDESVHAAATEVSQATDQFRAGPNSATLLNVHLACRDLKSQLFRYRSYFGTAATHGLRDAVLPVIDAALTALKVRQDVAILGAERVNLARQTAEGCRMVLVAERLR